MMVKTKMKENIYYGEIVADKELDECLKKCFVNHLLAYNYSLNLIKENYDIDFKTLKDNVYAHIREKNIEPVIFPALMNELYYQYKKFKDGIKTQKLITDIQYITVITNGYVNKILDINENLKELRFFNIPGKFTLSKTLPNIEDYSPLYFNISYSNITDSYMLSIFKL